MNYYVDYAQFGLRHIYGSDGVAARGRVNGRERFMRMSGVDGAYTHKRNRHKKQEIPAKVTGTSLLPFYSADTTTELVRALSTIGICYQIFCLRFFQ